MKHRAPPSPSSALSRGGQAETAITVYSSARPGTLNAHIFRSAARREPYPATRS